MNLCVLCIVKFFFCTEFRFFFHNCAVFCSCQASPNFDYCFKGTERVVRKFVFPFYRHIWLIANFEKFAASSKKIYICNFGFQIAKPSNETCN